MCQKYGLSTYQVKLSPHSSTQTRCAQIAPFTCSTSITRPNSPALTFARTAVPQVSRSVLRKTAHCRTSSPPGTAWLLIVVRRKTMQAETPSDPHMWKQFRNELARKLLKSLGKPRAGCAGHGTFPRIFPPLGQRSKGAPRGRRSPDTLSLARPATQPNGMSRHTLWESSPNQGFATFRP